MNHRPDNIGPGMISARILIVDDERAVTNVLVQVLEKVGCEVIAINSPTEVSRRLPELRPDLIILDFAMPDLTGPELAAFFQDNPLTRSIPIIFLSGLTHYDHHLIAQLSGAASYLEKPIDPEKLIRTAKEMLKHP